MKDADEPLIRAALDELLNWNELSRSPQLAMFLQYIVEARLAGADSSIKAYSIAVDVLGRPTSFDPQADPIVRVQGGRLRALLDRFYDEKLNQVPMRIRIPVGRYVPLFEPLDTDAIEEAAGAAEALAPEVQAPEDIIALRPPLWRRFAAPADAQAFRRRSALAIAAVCIVAIVGWVVFTMWRTGEDEAASSAAAGIAVPMIEIGTFTNLTGVAGLTAPVQGLGLQLLTDLSRFPDLQVRQRSNPDALAGATQSSGSTVYDLSGVVRRGNYGIEFTMLATNAETGTVAWTASLDEPVQAEDYPLLIGRVSREVGSILGSHRGPLHAAARRWAAEHPNGGAAPTPYICVNILSLAQDEQDPALAAGAITCFEHALNSDPDSAFAKAGVAGAEALQAWRAKPFSPTGEVELSDALKLARSARDTMPQSAFVRQQLARVLAVSGQDDEARQEYAAALQRNPADVDIRAEFGLMLATMGEWQVADAQAGLALEAAPSPPPWYYVVRAFTDLRDKKYDAAIASALIVARTDEVLGAVLALSAAPMAGRSDLIERFKPVVLNNPVLVRMGVLGWLGRHFQDQDMLREIGFGLLSAGVSPKIVSVEPITPNANGRRHP